MTKPLVTATADRILQRIIDGEYSVERPLPREAELAATLDVSRPTMREAVRALSSSGVLQVRHGVGTFVRPVHEWTDMRAIVKFESHNMEPVRLGLKLVELRRMVEVGAAGLAAENRDDSDITALRQILQDYNDAEAANDLDRIVEKDIEFHNRIVLAAKNPFLFAILHGIQEELAISRAATSAQPQIRERAKAHHRAIYEAIASGDVPGAKEAMRAHMTQTREDIVAFLS